MWNDHCHPFIQWQNEETEQGDQPNIMPHVSMTRNFTNITNT
jgi:hypothetical protein